MAVQVPEIPPGYKGNQRVFATIVYTALKQAGYHEVYFLYGKSHPGMAIGLDGSTIVVGNLENPAVFTAAEAQRCADKLNAEFRKVVPAAGGLATVRQGRTGIGSVRYAEVALPCPGGLQLRALRRGLLK